VVGNSGNSGNRGNRQKTRDSWDSRTGFMRATENEGLMGLTDGIHESHGTSSPQPTSTHGPPEVREADLCGFIWRVRISPANGKMRGFRGGR